MEPEKLREIVSENRALEEKLTKRNQQYIFDLNKSMSAANFSEEEKALALHDILPKLVEGQKKGETARQQFGTVSECMDAIINKPKEKKESTPLLMWLDNFMLFMGIFGLMVGVLSFFTKGNSTASYGVLTLIAGSAVGGWVLYLMYKYVYQYDRPGADKSKKPKMWKSMLLMVGAMFLWLVAFGLTGALPRSINPILDPILMIAIGGAALGIRYFLKKKYDIVGTFSAR